ncbi:galactokinase [Flavobacterium silvaticum]|uniref:Galactokinase n=1 Tax=Flavobacterium silvaticum TaxID=1852020 RepID=A0A972FV47_9FLAO|nr:galactokinase [Flavobacterium silvaticum]NMH28627.1 galactokinase [Flavobacterium silvaticum]
MNTNHNLFSDETELISKTSAFFFSRFQNQPDHIVLSPGRVNIIGEHIDYNDGFVLPAAIDKHICFAIRLRQDDSCSIVSIDLENEFHFSANDKLKPQPKMWANYFLGVLNQLQLKGKKIGGFELVFSSSIPMGSGLSSSAALECGFGFACNELFDLGLSSEEIAVAGQKAEHTFAGVNCGIMDQFASVFGKKDCVIKLDCTTLEYEYHEANLGDYAFILYDSCVKHTHLTSGYNDRRRDVEDGLAVITRNFPKVKTFRDCNESQLRTLKDELGEVIYKRCLFVANEIERVQNAVKALDHNNLSELGRLMAEAHHGLSTQYEVSCPEMDFLADLANADEAVLGSRMMGGGFGGCTINLVHKEAIPRLTQKLQSAYKTRFGIDIKVYPVLLSDGTRFYTQHATV